MNIQNQIKAIVVNLAINDQLSGDITQLDPSVFNHIAEELKARLQAISSKINDNIIDAWVGDLSNTIQAIAMEDFHGDGEKPEEITVEYNGWSDDLNDLIESL